MTENQNVEMVWLLFQLIFKFILSRSIVSQEPTSLETSNTHYIQSFDVGHLV